MFHLGTDTQLTRTANSPIRALLAYPVPRKAFNLAHHAPPLLSHPIPTIALSCRSLLASLELDLWRQSFAAADCPLWLDSLMFFVDVELQRFETGVLCPAATDESVVIGAVFRGFLKLSHGKGSCWLELLLNHEFRDSDESAIRGKVVMDLLDVFGQLEFVLVLPVVAAADEDLFTWVDLPPEDHEFRSNGLVLARAVGLVVYRIAAAGVHVVVLRMRLLLSWLGMRRV